MTNVLPGYELANEDGKRLIDRAEKLLEIAPKLAKLAKAVTRGRELERESRNRFHLSADAYERLIDEAQALRVTLDELVVDPDIVAFVTEHG